jgi:hypothetical protein
MKLLLAVTTCHRYQGRAEAQRQTWFKEIPKEIDAKFFLGNLKGYQPKPDEVLLDVQDDYPSLIDKVIATFKWALERGYDYVFKTDDDIYVRPERLLAAAPKKEDYIGRMRGPSGGFRAPYASGLGYWVSARAMRILVNAEKAPHIAEDRWVGNRLLEAGIACTPDYRYAVVGSSRNAVSAWEGPRIHNDIIAAAEYDPDAMLKIHNEWLTIKSEMRPKIVTGPLSDVSIMIKTFLRDACLWKCIEGIQKTLPECKMVIVDDGLETSYKISRYAKLRMDGHSCTWLPYDSGFGAKANASIPYCDRKYTLIGSDDFDFSNPEARKGIERMHDVLESDKTVDLAAGRVDGIPYEGLFSWHEDGVLRETFGYRETRTTPSGIEYKLCDLTVNYLLIRRSALAVAHWFDDIKIGGGEHGAFFLDMRRKGRRTAWVSGVNICQMPQKEIHPAYPAMRARARQPGRLALKRMGVNQYVCFGGNVEIC